jgi:hypothetical protein
MPGNTLQEYLSRCNRATASRANNGDRERCGLSHIRFSIHSLLPVSGLNQYLLVSDVHSADKLYVRLFGEKE